MPFNLVRDNLANQLADAIVLPANERLVIDGGSALQVAQKAGFDKVQNACFQIGSCPVGCAVATPAFEYPAKTLIHAVGPFCGQENEHDLLAKAYRSALNLAESSNCKSIAMPLISTGVRNIPEKESLAIAKQEILSFLDSYDLEITLVLFSRDSIDAASSLAMQLQEYIDDNYVDAFPSERRARTAQHQNAPLEPWESWDAPGGSGFNSDSMLCASQAPDPMPFASQATEPIPCCSPQTAPAASPHRKGRHSISLPHLPKFGKKKAQQDVSALMTEMDEPFSTTLLALIDARQMTDAEVYKRANMSRQLFSKIRGDAFYRPTKKTVLALCIALRLDLEETSDLLNRAGFSLSHASKFDVIVEYFIVNQHYDIFDINEMLYLYDQPLLG